MLKASRLQELIKKDIKFAHFLEAVCVTRKSQLKSREGTIKGSKINKRGKERRYEERERVM